MKNQKSKIKNQKSKIKNLFIYVLAISTLTFTSCQKEKNSLKSTESSNSILKNRTTFDISTNGIYLIFPSTEEYETLINNLTESENNDLVSVAKEMNYVSYAESLEQNSDLVDIIDNTLMSSLLNKDGVIQIGNYIYKINPATEKVYSMPSDKIDFYKDLVNEDVSKNYISVFDIWVDAIDAAESKGLCFESYAKSRSEDVNAHRTTGYAQSLIIHGRTRYQAFGVFFSLNAFVSSWVQGLSWNNLESDFPEYYTGGSGLKLRIDGSRLYKERCKNETGWMNWSVNGFSQSQNHKVELHSYQGSKGLNKYWLKTNFIYWNNLKQAWEDIGFLGDISPQSVIYYPYRSGVKYGY